MIGVRKMSAPCKRARGVTLIELLVVVSILAVALAVVAPGMVGLISDSRLSSQTDALVSALNLARLEAIKQRADVKLCASTDAATCSTATTATNVAAAWGNSWLIVKGATVLQVITSNSGVSVTPTTDTAKDVTFSGTFGSAATGSATALALCVSGRKQQGVEIAASGHVSKTISSSVTC